MCSCVKCTRISGNFSLMLSIFYICPCSDIISPQDSINMRFMRRRVFFSVFCGGLVTHVTRCYAKAALGVLFNSNKHREAISQKTNVRNIDAKTGKSTACPIFSLGVIQIKNNPRWPGFALKRPLCYHSAEFQELC